ncbi:MAG: HAD family hydrolase [Anaerolineales bacterium]|nr:HAD family hydrolase [Anaerolineales bacterium]
MNASPVRHILFDLGGTLMHARRNWLPVLEQADQALTETLRKYDIDLDSRTFRARLHQYYEQRDKDLQETTYHFVLRELLKELGYAEIAESILRSALDALYLITQKNWVLEDDALEMIRGLKSRNYQLGIFSNAGDDKDVQELVEGFGIRPYFDFVLTSAACFYRKPHPRTFEIALAQWSIPPEEAAMVGDSLIADMAGAKSLNIKTIWLTRRAHFSAEQEAGQRIEPDFSLSTLRALLPTLERINPK